MPRRLLIIASALLVGVLAPLAPAQIGIPKKIVPRSATRLGERSAVPKRQAEAVQAPAPGQRSFLKTGLADSKGSLLSRRSAPRPQANILSRKTKSKPDVTLLDRATTTKRSTSPILNRKTAKRPESTILNRKPPARAGSNLLNRQTPKRANQTLLNREAPKRTNSLLPTGPRRPTTRTARETFIPPNLPSIRRDVYRDVGKGFIDPKEAENVIKDRWDQELGRRKLERQRLGLPVNSR